MTVVQNGLSIALDDPALEPTPTWTSLYDSHVDGLRVQHIGIDRGRQYETDRMEAGVLTATIFDEQGILDTTNPFSPFAGKLDPIQRQIAFFVTNPITNVEHCLFRGFLENIETEMDVAMKHMVHTLTATDGLDTLANVEVIPDNAGDTVPTESVGDVFYENGPVNLRILAALADAGWPAGLTRVLSGNVDVQETVYSQGSSLLTVILDASDAEFPQVANFFIDKDGKATFLGRFARFNPSDASYHISHWHAGDGTACDASATFAPIHGLKFDRNKKSIYNAVLAAPKGILEADRSGQLAADATSVIANGVRSLTFENLLTEAGHELVPLDANDETRLFAEYYKDNYAEARTRVNEVRFVHPRDTSANLTAWWALICGVDLSDVITLETTHPAGGGFNDDFFVEGIHIEAEPLRNEYPKLDVTLDVSPAAYYTNNPF